MENTKRKGLALAGCITLLATGALALNVSASEPTAVAALSGSNIVVASEASVVEEAKATISTGGEMSGTPGAGEGVTLTHEYTIDENGEISYENSEFQNTNTTLRRNF